VEHRARRHALGVEDLEGLGPRLPGVDDEGEVELVRHRDLGGEDVALGVAGRVVVVEVESALPHGDARRVVEERAQPVETVAGLVRMDPGRGPHAVGGLGSTQRRSGRVLVDADVDHPLDAGRLCLVDHLLPALVGEVAVVVGPTHARLRP